MFFVESLSFWGVFFQLRRWQNYKFCAFSCVLISQLYDAKSVTAVLCVQISQYSTFLVLPLTWKWSCISTGFRAQNVSNVTQSSWESHTHRYLHNHINNLFLLIFAAFPLNGICQAHIQMNNWTQLKCVPVTSEINDWSATTAECIRAYPLSWLSFRSQKSCKIVHDFNRVDIWIKSFNQCIAYMHCK